MLVTPIICWLSSNSQLESTMIITKPYSSVPDWSYFKTYQLIRYTLTHKQSWIMAIFVVIGLSEWINWLPWPTEAQKRELFSKVSRRFTYPQIYGKYKKNYQVRWIYGNLSITFWITLEAPRYVIDVWLTIIYDRMLLSTHFVLFYAHHRMYYDERVTNRFEAHTLCPRFSLLLFHLV